MIQRCHNPKAHAYERYGGRGIFVCERWKESFRNFYTDMGVPEKGETLDRIDNDGPYSPENCRWATRKQQGRNTRVNRKVEIDGESKCVAEWSEATGRSRSAIHRRIKKGLTGSALIEPFQPATVTIAGETHTLDQWAEMFNLGRGLIEDRLKRGYSGLNLIKPAHKIDRKRRK